jgi:hypothetical protein
MMPTENRYGAWPRSGEIDMIEIRSNDNLICQDRHIGNKLMGSTLHFGIYNSTISTNKYKLNLCKTGTDSKHNIWRPTHYEA